MAKKAQSPKLKKLKPMKDDSKSPEDLVSIRFNTGQTPYNRGEVATFRRERAEQYSKRTFKNEEGDILKVADVVAEGRDEDELRESAGLKPVPKSSENEDELGRASRRRKPEPETAQA